MKERMAQVLTKMLEIYADPSAWCQGAGARTSKGNSIASTNPEAAKWCVVTCKMRAIDLLKIGAGPADDLSMRITNAIKAANDIYDLIEWNDTKGRTVGDVRAAIAKTLESIK